MSENVTITLNGKEIDVPRDATIREAAKSQGIEIPTFCFDDRLKSQWRLHSSLRGHLPIKY